jgi:hypothetical protein
VLEWTWADVYKSDLQSLYALLVGPIAFLAWRAAASVDTRRAEATGSAHFVSVLTLIFAIETMIDPMATGPLLKLEGLAGSPAATLIPFVFVLLGDLRVILLIVGVAQPENRLRRNLSLALGLSFVVPVFAGATFGLARWISPDVHGQILWMLYEFGFFALCIYLARIWVPERVANDPARVAFLRSVLGYSAAYYALWWVADFIIVFAELDLGWAIRIVPNQLYYAFWVPFVYWRFFSVRPENAAR